MPQNRNMNKNKRERIKKRQQKDTQQQTPAFRAASAEPIQKQSPFSKLTPEIITNICSLLFPTHHNLQDVFEVDGPAIIHHRWKDVYHLSLVDRRCRTIISPFLYRSIPILGPRSLTKLLSFLRFVTDKPIIAQGIRQLYLQLEVVNSGVTKVTEDDVRWISKQCEKTGTPFNPTIWRYLRPKQEFEWKGHKRPQTRVPERPMKQFPDEVEIQNSTECQRLEALLLALLRRLPGLVDIGLEHGKRLFPCVDGFTEDESTIAENQKNQGRPRGLPLLPDVRSVAMKINRSASEWQQVDENDMRILMEICPEAERLSVEDLKPYGRSLPVTEYLDHDRLPWLAQVRELTLINSRSIDEYKEMASIHLYILSCPGLEVFRFMAKYRETREGTPHRVRVPHAAMRFIEYALMTRYYLETIVLDLRHCTQCHQPPVWKRLGDCVRIDKIYLHLGQPILEGRDGYRDRNRRDREATDVLKSLPMFIRKIRLGGEFWQPKPLKRLIRNHRLYHALHDIELEKEDYSGAPEVMASLRERFAKRGYTSEERVIRSPQSKKPIDVGTSAAKIWPRPLRLEWREDAPEILKWTNRGPIVHGPRTYSGTGAKLVTQKRTTMPVPRKTRECALGVWVQWMHPATEPGAEPTIRCTNILSQAPAAIWPNYEDVPRLVRESFRVLGRPPEKFVKTCEWMRTGSSIGYLRDQQQVLCLLY